VVNESVVHFKPALTQGCETLAVRLKHDTGK